VIRILVDNIKTYMPPFVMTLSRILRLYHGPSLVEFRFLHVETLCHRQNAIRFDVVKEEVDFVFSPPAIGLLSVFRCTSGVKSVMVGS